MTRDERKAILNIVLMAVKLQVNQPHTQSLYGDKGLCHLVANLLIRKFSDVEAECGRLFEEYTNEWAHKHNPNWTEFADIYIIPGQPGGGLNKLAYYEARRQYLMWDKSTEYGRARHQLLDDLIEATKDTSHVRSQDQEGSNTDK